MVLDSLRKNISPKRFEHSLNVANLAKQLATIYKEEPDRAELAGQFHDCAREMSVGALQQYVEQNQIKVEPFERQVPITLHAPVGAHFAKKEYGLVDEQVLSAMRWHTIGKLEMNLLEKILFVADFCSQDRKFPEAERIREIAKKDLDHAVFLKFFLGKKHNDLKKRINTPQQLEYISLHAHRYNGVA